MSILRGAVANGHEGTVEEMDRSQTLLSVVRAEVLRLIATGGVRGWLILSVFGGIACAVGVVAVAAIPSLSDIARPGFADALTAGPSCVAVVLSVGALTAVPRFFHRGVVMSSKCLVPRISRLFSAMLIAWGLLCLIAAGGTALIGGILAVVWPGLGFSPEPRAFGSLLFTLALGATVVVMAVSLGMILRNGALAILGAALLIFVIPLVLALVALKLGGSAGAFLSTANSFLPGPVLQGALQVSGDTVFSWQTWLFSVGRLSGWLIVLVSVAYIVFRGPD